MTFQYNKELIFQEFKVAADKDINTTTGKKRKKETYDNRIQFFKDHIETKKSQPRVYENLNINFEKLLETWSAPNPRDAFYMAVFGKTYAEKMREQENEDDIAEDNKK